MDRRGKLYLLLALTGVGAFPALAAPAEAAGARSYWVSTRGDDAAPGTRARPLKSVRRALDLSRGGELVNVLPGLHRNTGARPSWTHHGVRRRPVIVRGVGDSPAVLEDLSLNQATGIRFERLRFQGTLTIFGGGRISVANNEFTGAHSPAGVANAIVLRGGAKRVTIERNWFHHVASAIVGPPAPKVSSLITIRENVMEDLRVDGIQFGFWRNTTIEGNVIRRIQTTNPAFHNDGIQSYGAIWRTRILRNTITESHHQGILIGDEKGPIDDLLIESNVITQTGAYPLYLFGGTRVRILGNTVWRAARAQAAGIVLRRRDNTTTPSDAIIANNIASRIATYMPVAVRDWNLVGSKGVQYGQPAPHELLGAEPAFLDAAGLDMRLADTSPARGRGNPAFAGTGLDRLGRPRSSSAPTLGAFE